MIYHYHCHILLTRRKLQIPKAWIRTRVVWHMQFNKKQLNFYICFCMQLVTEYFNNTSGNCRYPLTIHQNSTKGNFLEISYKIESETLSMSFSYCYIKIHCCFLHASFWPHRSSERFQRFVGPQSNILRTTEKETSI